MIDLSSVGFPVSTRQSDHMRVLLGVSAVLRIAMLTVVRLIAQRTAVLLYSGHWGCPFQMAIRHCAAGWGKRLVAFMWIKSMDNAVRYPQLLPTIKLLANFKSRTEIFVRVSIDLILFRLKN